MPIDRKKFDKGIGDLSFAIFQLLAKNPKNAYSFDEIRDNLQNKYFLGLFDIDLTLALMNLKNRNIIIGKNLDGKSYYAINEEILKELEEII